MKRTANPFHLRNFLARPGLSITVLFLLALMLRTAGLSNDLHHGRIYHPDTPKQIRATERFLVGEYYTIIGGRDYEGYPYFNSHLAEYFVRGYLATRAFVRAHLGLPHTDGTPSHIALFWIIRLMNATLSALAVVLVYVIGARFFSRGVGLLGSLFLALSPADITAAHYAAGDVTAAFFALCSVGCALRIADKGRYRNYILAAFFAAAAFSTKYHGGMAILVAGLAHLSVYRSPRAWFSAPSLRRAAVLFVCLLIGIFLTSPALLVYPESAYKDIVAFIEYTSSFGMTAEMAQAPLHRRFFMGMSLNMPVLLDILGAVIAGTALIAVLIHGKRWPTWLIATVPLVYILAGLSTKPLTHPVYHTMATPYIMLLAGLTLDRLFRLNHGRLLSRTAATALTIWATIYLASYAYRETFFFRHNDTRYLASVWVEDHVPSPFHVQTWPYTFSPSARHAPEENADGRVYVFSERVPVRPPDGAVGLGTLSLEREKLSVFRNWPQHLFLLAPHHVRDGFSAPGLQPVPSPFRRTMLHTAMPSYLRSETMWTLNAGERFGGSLAAKHPIPEAAWIVRAGRDPSVIRLSFGKRTERLRLEAHETRFVPIHDPRPVRMARAPYTFYPWQVRAEFGAATVRLAITDRDRAWSHFNLGHFDEAWSAFDKIAQADRSPGDDIARNISGILAGALTHSPVAELSEMVSDTFRAYGLSDEFLRALPAHAMDATAFRMHKTADENADKHVHYLESAFICLEPGHYLAELQTDNDATRFRVEVRDALGQSLQTTDKTEHDHDVIRVPFVIAHQQAAIQLRMYGEADNVRLLNKATIRPDPMATVREYSRLMDAFSERSFPAEDFSGLSYLPLLRWAHGREAEGKFTEAAQAYAAAVRAEPGRLRALQHLNRIVSEWSDIPDEIKNLLGPYHATAPLREVHPTSVTLRNDMRLNGYALSTRRVRAGESFGIRLFWETPSLGRPTARHAAWIHGIPAGQRAAVFHGDRRLMDFLRMRDDLDLLVPPFVDIAIPKDIAPGTYDIKVGVWIPAHRRNIRVREADVPHDRRGACIAVIEIVE